jgi:hypothetical protein
MKIKTFLLALLALPSIAFAGAPELKAMSCMFEIEAEAYRLARLSREIAFGSLSPDQLYKIKAQLKSSTQELFLNLHEAKPGLSKMKMQAQYQRLDDAISDYVAEGLSSGNDKTFSALRGKQTELVKLADQIQLTVAQRSGNASAGGLTLIGTAKINTEKMAHDYEFCAKNCAQILPGDFAALSQNIESMRETLPTKFSKGNYNMAKIQLDFLKLAMDARIKAEPTDLAQSNMLATSSHLWTLIDEVLDAYVD